METNEKLANQLYLNWFKIEDEIQEKTKEIENLEGEIKDLEILGEEDEEYLNDLNYDIDNLNTEIDWLNHDQDKIDEELYSLFDKDNYLKELYNSYCAWRF